MTSTDPKREPRESRERRESGYRGALPPRNDTLAKPWIFVVAAVVVLMFVLSALGIPSRFEPDPTPRPSVSASASASPAASQSAEASLAASEEPAESASVEASPSP